jgi:hypothetical protein
MSGVHRSRMERFCCCPAMAVSGPEPPAPGHRADVTPCTAATDREPDGAARTGGRDRIDSDRSDVHAGNHKSIIHLFRDRMDRYSEESMHTIRVSLERDLFRWPGVTTRLIFCLPGYIVNGKVFALLVTGGIILTKLPEIDRALVFKRFQTVPVTGHGGVITEWVQIILPETGDLSTILPLVKKSYDEAAG